MRIDVRPRHGDDEVAAILAVLTSLNFASENALSASQSTRRASRFDEEGDAWQRARDERRRRR